MAKERRVLVDQIAERRGTLSPRLVWYRLLSFGFLLIFAGGLLGSLAGRALGQTGCCYCASCNTPGPNPFCFDAVNFQTCAAFCQQQQFKCSPQFGTNQTCGGGCASNAPVPTPSPTQTATRTPTALPTATPPKCCQCQGGLSCGEPVTPAPSGPEACPTACVLMAHAGCAGSNPSPGQMAGSCYSIPTPTYTNTALPTATFTPLLSVSTDHYKCYKAKGTPLALNAGFIDDFESVNVNDKKIKPAFFCNPAEVRLTPGATPTILHPKDRLLCYYIDEPPNRNKFMMTLRNLLGEKLPVEAQRAKMYCVPSNVTPVP